MELWGRVIKIPGFLVNWTASCSPKWPRSGVQSKVISRACLCRDQKTSRPCTTKNSMSGPYSDRRLFTVGDFNWVEPEHQLKPIHDFLARDSPFVPPAHAEGFNNIEIPFRRLCRSVRVENIVVGEAKGSSVAGISARGQRPTRRNIPLQPYDCKRCPTNTSPRMQTKEGPIPSTKRK